MFVFRKKRKWSLLQKFCVLSVVGFGSTLIYLVSGKSRPESTEELLKMFEMFGNATTDLNPIGLGQDDPALVRFIAENCLAHPQHDVKLFPVSCSGLGPT